MNNVACNASIARLIPTPQTSATSGCFGFCYIMLNFVSWISSVVCNKLTLSECSIGRTPPKLFIVILTRTSLKTKDPHSAPTSPFPCREESHYWSWTKDSSNLTLMGFQSCKYHESFAKARFWKLHRRHHYKYIYITMEEVNRRVNLLPGHDAQYLQHWQ